MQELARSGQVTFRETLADQAHATVTEQAAGAVVEHALGLIVTPSPPLTLQEFADNLSSLYEELAWLTIDESSVANEGNTI